MSETGRFPLPLSAALLMGRVARRHQAMSSEAAIVVHTCARSSGAMQ